MYTLVLTHDIDFWSACELPLLGRGHLSFVKRCLVGNMCRLISGELGATDYLRGMASSVAVTTRLGPDPWVKSFWRMVETERRRGLKSTIFVIPLGGASRPAAFNASDRRCQARYDLADIGGVLRQLEHDGWEIGVHGLNAHASARDALAEREAVQALGVTVHGYRSHWLVTSPSLHDNLRWAGFAYDSSMRASTYGVRAVLGTDARRLDVIPIDIQDKDVLETAGSRRAWSEIEARLERARERGATVTVLWHTNQFGPPRFWSSVYERILDHALRSDAAIMTAFEYVCALRQGDGHG